jgi:hypothetical protein
MMSTIATANFVCVGNAIAWERNESTGAMENQTRVTTANLVTREGPDIVG